MSTPNGDFAEISDLTAAAKSSHDFGQAECFDRNNVQSQGFIRDAFRLTASWDLAVQFGVFGGQWWVNGQTMVFGASLNVRFPDSFYTGVRLVDGDPVNVVSGKVTGIAPAIYHDIFFDSPIGNDPLATIWGWFFSGSATATVEFYEHYRAGIYSFEINAGGVNNGFNVLSPGSGSSQDIYLISRTSTRSTFHLASWSQANGLTINLPSFQFDSVALVGKGNFSVIIVSSNMGLSLIEGGYINVPSSGDWRDATLPGNISTTGAGISFAGTRTGNSP